jgi:hypothetical protein
VYLYDNKAYRREQTVWSRVVYICIVNPFPLHFSRALALGFDVNSSPQSSSFNPTNTSTDTVRPHITSSTTHSTKIHSPYQQLTSFYRHPSIDMVPPLMHKGRHDSQPKVTFYLTLVLELHEATDQYTYSIE